MQQAVTPKQTKNDCSECNSATGTADSITVHDTEQMLAFKGFRKSSSSDEEPKSEEGYMDVGMASLKYQASKDATSNSPEVTKSECSEYNGPTGASDFLTAQDIKQKVTSKGP